METFADRYYKPSGAVPLFGTILMQLFGAAGALILGALYAAANYYSPSIWLTGLAVAAFGAGVGFAVHLGARLGKVRSPGFVLLLGMATGILAIYFAWVFYIYLFWRQMLGVPMWAWNPVQIHYNMTIFAIDGIWAMESWTPKGWVLYAFWAAEALCVVGLSVVVSVANDTPYCDRCNTWTKKEKDVADFALTDGIQLKTDLEEERYEVLDTLHAQPKDASDCLKAVIHACPQCEDSDYLTINHSRILTDSDGVETTNETEVVKHLLIPRELTAHLRELATASPVLPVAEPAPEDAQQDEVAY